MDPNRIFSAKAQFLSDFRLEFHNTAQVLHNIYTDFLNKHLIKQFFLPKIDQHYFFPSTQLFDKYPALHFRQVLSYFK